MTSNADHVGIETPAFVCPVCRAQSWHPEDGRQGYCARCKDFTRERVEREQADAVEATLRAAFPGIPVVRHADLLRQPVRMSRAVRVIRAARRLRGRFRR